MPLLGLARFTLENTPTTVPVKCTDSENPFARTCIPATIIIQSFAQENGLTEQIAMGIVQGITNAARLSKSQDMYVRQPQKPDTLSVQLHSLSVDIIVYRL